MWRTGRQSTSSMDGRRMGRESGCLCKGTSTAIGRERVRKRRICCVYPYCIYYYISDIVRTQIGSNQTTARARVCVCVCVYSIICRTKRIHLGRFKMRYNNNNSRNGKEEHTKNGRTERERQMYTYYTNSNGLRVLLFCAKRTAFTK